MDVVSMKTVTTNYVCSFPDVSWDSNQKLP